MCSSDTVSSWEDIPLHLLNPAHLLSLIQTAANNTRTGFSNMIEASKTKTLQRILTALILVLFASSAALASTQTVTATGSGTLSSAPGSTTITVTPPFNPALGTLVQVDISFSYTQMAEVDVINSSTTTDEHFTNATAQIPLSLTGPNALSLFT